jgi:microcompartment protein CcmK/EutM
MLRLHQHGHAARVQLLIDRRGDLRGQRLLRLQALREHVDKPRQLREADDAVGRIIGDMRLADEGHDVVLAMRKKRDVAHQNQIVVAFDLGEYALQDFLGILPVAAE